MELREECVRDAAGLMSGVRVSARSHWSKSSSNSSSVGPPRALTHKYKTILGLPVLCSLKHISKHRPFLWEHASRLLVQALVRSRLHYCDALSTGLPASSIEPLQLIQNTVARLHCNELKRTHVTPLFINLHWLLVVARYTDVTVRCVPRFRGHGSIRFRYNRGKKEIYFAQFLFIYFEQTVVQINKKSTWKYSILILILLLHYVILL